ncbi:hypothetical protein DdX_08971 [Ditylenchus destructor]|uniref:Uncharacterized protein n=1 Tax=Ditylenchus destructor TaxID=166010 RepID=A0AAD4N4G8_9BILA|nr:hypothetical protein DdX_08971 [Ditylenchus destructor]
MVGLDLPLGPPPSPRPYSPVPRPQPQPPTGKRTLLTFSETTQLSAFLVRKLSKAFFNQQNGDKLGEKNMFKDIETPKLLIYEQPVAGVRLCLWERRRLFPGTVTYRLT